MPRAFCLGPELGLGPVPLHLIRAPLRLITAVLFIVICIHAAVPTLGLRVSSFGLCFKISLWPKKLGNFHIETIRKEVESLKLHLMLTKPNILSVLAPNGQWQLD